MLKKKQYESEKSVLKEKESTVKNICWKGKFLAGSETVRKLSMMRVVNPIKEDKVTGIKMSVWNQN